MSLDPLYDRQIRALSVDTNKELQSLRVYVLGTGNFARELTKQLVLLGVAYLVSDAEVGYVLTSRTERVASLKYLDYVFVCDQCENQAVFAKAGNAFFINLTEDEVWISDSLRPQTSIDDYLTSNIGACAFLYWFVAFISKGSKRVFAPAKISF